MNYTILIADDEPEIRTLLRLYLENENYQIIEAENGKQALDLLKKERVDLCLLDIMMPEMDGYHVLQELRKTSNIPSVLFRMDVHSTMHYRITHNTGHWKTEVR